MIVFGLVSTVFDLLTFALLLNVFESDAPTFQTAWFVVSLLTEIAVVMVLRTSGPAWRSAPSGLLVWTSVVVGLTALAIPYAGPFVGALGFVPLSWPLMGGVLAIVAAYVVSTEAVKLSLFGRGHR